MVFFNVFEKDFSFSQRILQILQLNGLWFLKENPKTGFPIGVFWFSHAFTGALGSIFSQQNQSTHAQDVEELFAKGADLRCLA